MRILFDSKKEQFKTPFGVLTPEGACTLHVHIPCSCRTRAVFLLVEDCYGRPFAEFPFRLETRDDPYEIFRCDFSLRERGLYFYYFRMETEGSTFRLFKQGNDTNMEAGDKWQLSCVPADFLVPESCQGAVMYQIFPDRFFQAGSCDLTGKLAPYWIHENRDDTPEYRPNAQGEVLNNDFFGGNLRGIMEKLPYLQELGVRILYLNPIFLAFSNHRYDTADYKRIDPMLGTEEDFRALCARAKECGIRVILDGVFNHVGSNSVYFDAKHVFGGGAVSDPQSRYRDWFRFQHYPDVYESWWGITTLPCVDERNEDFAHYIIDDEDSVVAHWMQLGAGGYRLDVVDELPDDFVLRLKKRTRAIDPNAFLIGEVWEDASNKVAYDVSRRYFVDGELDSVMNYPWQKAIIRFVKGYDDGTALGNTLMTLAENYPKDVLNAVMNLLSTHDTARILTVLGDDFSGSKDECAERRLSPQARREALEKLKMAAFLQYTLPGNPCIFYGDEAGMEGFRDPFCRRYFPWASRDRELTRYYTGLGELKNHTQALRFGSLRVVRADSGHLSFLRRSEADCVQIFVNRSGQDWQINVTGQLLFGVGIAQVTRHGGSLQPGGYCAVRVQETCREETP